MNSLNKLSQEIPNEKEVNFEITNSLVLKVADEITRMRQRLVSMPTDINGIAQLLKSLDRLEDELKVLGFEIPALLNMPFDDGMTVKARFIPTEGMNPGEKIITKVIRPQINYNGQLVQIAEVEVSIGV